MNDLQDKTDDKMSSQGLALNMEWSIDFLEPRMEMVDCLKDRRTAAAG